MKNEHAGGGVYGLGMIGARPDDPFGRAAVYYIQQATSFGSGVVGILKAIIWPAFLVYKMLGL